MTLSSPFQASLHISDEEMAHGFFVQDDTHFSHALTPLFASLMIPAMSEGTRAAFENLQFPLAQFLARVHDGYFYQAQVPYPGDPAERANAHAAYVESGLETFRARFEEIVQNTLLPAYAEMRCRAAEPLTRERALEDLDWLFRKYTEIMQIHFEVVLPRMSVAGRLVTTYAKATGRDEPAAVYALMNGLPNQSLATDRELWKVAQLVRSSSRLTDVFATTPLPDILGRLEGMPEAAAFRDAFAAFLDSYGLRCSHSHEVSEPTWQEEPSYALGMVRAYAFSDRDFDREMAETVRRREEALEALSREPGVDGEALAEFLALRERALRMWNLDEDHHFYIDAMLPASARGLLLHIADLLRSEGQLQEPGDLFYLYLDEVRDLLSDPDAQRPDLIRERRALHERQRHAKPRPTIGTPPAGAPEPDAVISHVFGTIPEPMDSVRRILHGSAASAGLYTGIARVVEGHEQFAEVRSGEVLVCRTTTPTWTVLFPVVGAIVTDAGGILSHAATVAREYRVPCVVGTKSGTEVLHSGDLVTVDGYRGTVTIDRPA